jgi:hypothetical protein
MKLWLLSVFLVLLALPTFAQGQEQGMSPLQMEPQERQFFALGITLARGAFAYAELAKQAAVVAKTRSKIAQVGQLGGLDEVAGRNRAEAREQIMQAVVLMRQLRAPDTALAPVAAAGAKLAGPLALTADAKPLALFNRAAARTVSSLSEFETLSSLPEDPAVRAWLNAPEMARSAQVWYGEGEIAGLSEIAAEHQMPELLPPTEQIATDLRGLRDWLALRLPDTLSPEQAALKKDLNAFLEETSRADRPGIKSRRRLTLPQLDALGSISRRLQTQVLGSPSAESAANFPKPK